MKIIFTSSKRPNFFTRLISSVEGKWTHCGVLTDVTIPPNNEPLVMHSQWNAGLSLIPLSLFLGRKDYEAYDTYSDFDWVLAYQHMAVYGGVERYGFALVVGHLLRFLGIEEPNWLVQRYKHEAHCSKYVLLKLRQRGLLTDLDLDKTGPGALRAAIAENKNFTKLERLIA